MEVCFVSIFYLFMIWRYQTPDRIEHCIVLEAVLESVVVFRVASRAVAEAVVPFGFAEAGSFSRRPVVLGVVAAAE